MDTKAKMDPRIKKEWVKRLRSGDYEQGIDLLKTPQNKYCCLGVLADIFLDEKDLDWNYCELNEDVYLIPEIAEWAGLGGYGDDISVDEIKETLVSMNDDGHSFNEIADVIEENL